jgi:bacterioferritin-associated ferredoxin
MYVCICKGITENQICDAIRGGLCTRKEISRCLKVGTACGKCNHEVGNLLARSLSIDDSSLMSLLSVSRPESSAGKARPHASGVVPVMETDACLA